MQSKKLKPPRPRKSEDQDSVQLKRSGAHFTERDYYECLVDIEKWLASCLSGHIKTFLPTKAKGKKKATAIFPEVKISPQGSPSPACAGEVFEYGVKKGWVKSHHISAHRSTSVS
jgi:serine/threonine-protein kinase haspin